MLNSISVNVARAVGSVLGGSLVAVVGAPTCFLLNMLTFLVVLVSLYRMRSSEIAPSTRLPRRPGQLREGLAYAVRTPQIALPLLMLTITGILAYELPITLPLVATDAFEGGPATYGLMAAAMATGAVVGGLVVASRKEPAGYETLAITCLGWGGAILLAAVAPNLPLEMLALLAVGYGSISFNATSKTAMQLAGDAWQGDGAVGHRVDQQHRHRRPDRGQRVRALPAGGPSSWGVYPRCCSALSPGRTSVGRRRIQRSRPPCQGIGFWRRKREHACVVERRGSLCRSSSA